MKIILHGVLADRFGREFQIATDIPADAIEGLSRQIPDWPRDMRIDVLGFDTERKLRHPTAEQEIHLVPSMFGGGGKWGMIILGVALIAVSFVMPAAGFAIGAVTISSGTVFMMGVGLTLAGVSQLFMKAPTIDKSEDPPASKYFAVNKNTTAIGTLMTMAWGRIKLHGQWLSIQVDSNDLVTTSFPATTS